MKWEKRTIGAMIHIYCRAHHGTSGELCQTCTGLLAYAEERIDRCPFGTAKPVCNRCTVHCYQPAMREQVRVVMRFAGPRMPMRHPVLALRHLVRSRFYRAGRSK
jgi:hypothetical protein